MRFSLPTLVLMAVLMTSFVSAASVFPVEVTGNSSSVNPGETFDVRFKIKNDLAEQNVSRVVLAFLERDTAGLSLGKLKAAKYGTLNLPVLTVTFEGRTLAGAVLEDVKILNKTTTPEFFTATFEADRALSPNIYRTSLKMGGKNDAGADVEIDSVPVSFTLLPKPVISMTEVQKLMANQTGILNVTNTGNANIASVNMTASGAAVTFSVNNFALNAQATRAVEVRLADSETLNFGSTEVDVIARDAANPSLQSTHKFVLTKSFCRAGPAGANLSITQVDINNDGGDEDDWKPLDQIRVEVEVENNGQSDLSDVVVELGLFDSSGKNVANKLKFSNKDEEKIKVGRIGDDDEERATFTFVIPGDLDAGSYKVAVKAYSRKTGETLDCADRSSDLDNTLFESVSVDREDDEGKFIAFDNTQLSAVTASCGETLTLNADVFNVGDEDQDRVKVTLVNRELKVDLAQEIINLDIGDDKPVSFAFTVPQGTVDKSYNLDLSASYDYNNGVYRQSLDDSKKIILRVVGCPVQARQAVNAEIATATLESEASAGKPLVVRAEVRNTGTQQGTFTLSAKGYESWAKLQNISDAIVTLDAGATKAVLLTFNVDNSASGRQSFSLEVSDGTRTLQSQPVEVNIRKAGLDIGSSQALWILGIINLILIILIIVVAVRLARR